MLTPAFELSQNEEFLIVSIQIPYAKVSEVEVHFEDSDFMFYSKPYYLRLNLPGSVQYSEKPAIDFNLDKKILTVKAPKSVKGQVFEGLDLITKLLVPKKKMTSASPMIEIIDGLEPLQESDEDFDWSIDQIPCQEFGSILEGDHCGFANSYTYAIFKLKEETQEIFDVREPQNKSLCVRKEERLNAEADQFDEDHYIADLYHDETIQDLLKYKPEWEKLFEKLQATPSAAYDDLIQFTPGEKEKLRKLPNKDYILDKNQIKQALLGLVDIMLAYAYNKRTMEGDNTVESAWTVNKLSATLSWLESFSSVSDVALTFIRRSLSYPLYRHFELSVTILEDVRKMLLLGRKYIIKCFLDIHEMFSFSEPRYIMNDLFIVDYCVWLQTEKCSSKKLEPLAEALGKVLFTKGDVGFNLVDIESFARIAWMAHNSSTKDFYSINKEANEKVSSANSSEATDALCINMEKLSIQKMPSNNSEISTVISNNLDQNMTFDLPEFGACSSCSSYSSSSSSNTFETDSDSSYSDYTSSDSNENDVHDTGSSSDSDDDAHSHLLKKLTKNQ